MKLLPFSKFQLSAVLGTALALLSSESPSTNGSQETPPVQSVVPTTSTQPELVSAAEVSAEEGVRAPLALSSDLQEVVKLSQSGVGEEVVVAYIQNVAHAFNPTPDEILYLTDIGISDVVITALVNHGRPETSTTVAAEAPAYSAIPSGPPPEAPPAFAPTYNPEPPAGALPGMEPPPPAPVVVYEPAPAVDYNYFYSSLSPYGSWVDVNDYGLCWQPTVAVIHSDWRPYCDRGRWLDSDCGWYWHSDYSWGWAPFHYGRWFHHPVRGWCWRPDSVWAPAWVSWRYSDAYCGWAPLPPGSHFRAGIGFTYYGAHVGAGFGFGLGREAWTFVPGQRMHDPEVWRHRLAPNQIANVYHRSTVINNYVVNNNTIINHGVGDHVAGLGRSDGPKVSVRDLPDSHGGVLHPDRLHQDGAQVVVYRPKLPQPTPPVGGGPSAIQRGGVAERPSRVSNPEPALRGSTVVGVKGSTAGPLSPQANTPTPYRVPVSPGGPARVESTRSWPNSPTSPAGVAQPSPAARQEPPRATVGTSQNAGVQLPPAQQIYRNPAKQTPQGWNQAGSFGAGNGPIQRPSFNAPQAVTAPRPANRQDAPKTTAPAATERFSQNVPVYQAPRVETAPAVRPSYPTPSPSYSAPAPAVRVPSYSAPSYSAPVSQQPRPSYSPPAVAAPAPSRPPPQAAPAPAQSNRRQQ